MGESLDSPGVHLMVHPYIGNSNILNKTSHQSTLKRRKNSLRLSEFDYSAPHAYSITICTSNWQEFFSDDETARKTLGCLFECVNGLNYRLFAFCLMPDHLHLLISPQESKTSLSEFIRQFKSRTSFHFKQGKGLTLWQRGFYDHVVRKSEDLKGISDYMLHNPVRKGLAKNPEEYLYSGPHE